MLLYIRLHVVSNVGKDKRWGSVLTSFATVGAPEAHVAAAEAQAALAPAQQPAAQAQPVCSCRASLPYVALPQFTFYFLGVAANSWTRAVIIWQC